MNQQTQAGGKYSNAELAKKAIDALCGSLSARRGLRKRKSGNGLPPTKQAGSKVEKKIAEIVEVPNMTLVCGCCGKKNARQGRFMRIDSGQLLCPACLNELRCSS